MPQVFKIGSYIVYFWLNESLPLEPIHVHVAEGTPSVNATKIWLTKSGGTVLCNNNSQVPARQLRIIMDVIETRHAEIEDQWLKKFGEISYYC